MFIDIWLAARDPQIEYYDYNQRNSREKQNCIGKSLTAVYRERN